ncbi:MAG: hypothetical protein U9N56_09940 [Actinomycetota bacterium]|nr:hypothetical protein [Actinomycetota bacterium]
MTHHRRGLRRLLRDDELAQRIEDDWRTSGISDTRIAMLTYAEKLTGSPGEVEEADVISLRDAGFSDTDVLHIAEVTAYYAYVNRIADGLGIPLEDWISED